MSDRRSASDLGTSAEASLSTFPFPERDWEADARAIEARLTESVRGSTDALLLAAPLPSEANEPSSLSATATPLTHSGVRTQSLAEVARRSVEKKQANERQMARESLAIAAQQRQVPVDAQALREAVQPRLIEAARPAPSVESVAPIGSAAAIGVAPVASKPWPKIALVFPALAIAAAAVLWFRQPKPEPVASSAIAPVAPTALAPAAAPSALAENQPSAAQELPRGIDPSSLPGEAASAADSATAKVASAPVPKSGVAAIALKGAQAALSKDAADKSLPPDPGLRPADSHSGELPAKPTTGAVQAALGSVMSGARHCVAGDDAPSSAVVVFGSDGRVQHVTVSGAAAGKSSASCIEAQLSRARVQPFAASNFSVNATVRPELPPLNRVSEENPDLGPESRQSALTSRKASLIVPAPRALPGPF